MNRHFISEGYSLLECCIVLCIVLSLSAFIPNIHPLLVYHDQNLILDTLKSAIAYARNEAFLRRTTISLCPSMNGISCSLNSDWSTGFIVFENQENEKQANPHSVLETFEGAHYGRVYFSASGNQLHIRSNGTTTNIGTFLYSPTKKSFLKPKGLVVNWAVRTYILNETSLINPNTQ